MSQLRSASVVNLWFDVSYLCRPSIKPIKQEKPVETVLLKPYVMALKMGEAEDILTINQPCLSTLEYTINRDGVSWSPQSIRTVRQRAQGQPALTVVMNRHFLDLYVCKMHWQCSKSTAIQLSLRSLAGTDGSETVNWLDVEK